MVDVDDVEEDSASDVSSGEDDDEDSQPGDLQSCYEDDTCCQKRCFAGEKESV